MAELPALPDVQDSDLRSAGLMQMAPGLAVFFNTALYERCAKLAGVMSRAEGVTPRHLLGKPEACFAVISRSITWSLDPFAVACSTYQTPSGQIGFEGKLVQAILENSGKIEGRVLYEHFGDWTKVRGKFKWETSAKGHKYAVAGWDMTKDEEGLGVKVIVKVKNEVEPRTEEFLMASFHPRNSTLWALRPDQQICYAACRAFANIAAPGILMGVPFDTDPVGFYGEPLTDITPPRPARQNAFERPAPAKATEPAHDNHEAQDVGAPETEQSAEPAAGQAQPEPDAEPAPGAAGDAEDAPAQPAAEIDKEWLHQQFDNLAKCSRVSDVGELREAVETALEDDSPARREWEAACDNRTRAILQASATPKPRRSR